MSRLLLAFVLGSFVVGPAWAGRPQGLPEGWSRIEQFAQDPMVVFGGARLGVEVTELTSELRTHFGAPLDRGVLVARVMPDSAAAKAGLEVGDVIVALGATGVEDGFGLRRAVQEAAGKEVSVEIRRDGKERTLTATIEAREPAVDGRARTERFEIPNGHGQIWTWSDEDGVTVDPERLEDLMGRLGRMGAVPTPPGDLDDLHGRIDDLEQQLLEMTERLQEATERIEDRLEAMDEASGN